MSDIRIKKKSFLSFTLGIVVTIVALFMIGFVFAASIVYNAGSGRINNLADPEAGDEAVPKSYVDAAGGLTVYEGDNSTVVGKFLGLNLDNAACHRIIYTPDDANSAATIPADECYTDYNSGTIYFTSTDCSSGPWSSGSDNRIRTNDGSNNRFWISAGSGSCCGYSYNSYENTGGCCNGCTGSTTNKYGATIQTLTCGPTGDCLVR